MNNSAVVNSNYDNVVSAIELLADSVTKYENALMDSIAQLAKDRQTEQIRETLAQTERVKCFFESITDLKDKWSNVVNGDDDELLNTPIVSEDTDKRVVTARTSWKVAGDSVKIETARPDGPPYSNVIPLSIFKEIATNAVKFIERNGSVKTSEVLNLLSKKIISQSDYKKTPRIPVYATFKVLVKENILKIDEHNSHKYLLGISKNKAISWIEEL